MDELLNLFCMLSDRTRLRILLLLLGHEMCVCEIFATLDMSQPRVSRQLSILKQARLIKDRRDGKWIYYKIEDNEYTKYLMAILPFLPGWLEKDPEYTNDRAMLRKINVIKNTLENCGCNCKLDGGNENGEEGLLRFTEGNLEYQSDKGAED